MTVEQAQAQVDRCEQELRTSHIALCNAASRVGASTKEWVLSMKRKKVWITVLISLIGLCFGGWGIFIIAGGLYIAYKMNENGNNTLRKVEEGQKNLISTIDANINI